MLGKLRHGIFLLLLSAPVASADDEPIRVGSKSFTEGIILGDIATLWLRENGFNVEHKKSIGDAATFQALRQGDIDVYSDYTGTLRESIYAGRSLDTRAKLEAALAEDGLRMTEPLGFQNSFAIGTTQALAEKYQLHNISDLRSHPDLELGFTESFLNRGDGWPSLKRTYNLPQTQPRGMDHELAYDALVEGSLDVIDFYTTDPEVLTYNLVALEDDRHHFTEYEAVYVYRADIDPKALATLRKLTGRFSTDEMLRVNARVKIDHWSDEQAAAEFLNQTFGTTMVVQKPSFWRTLWVKTIEHLGMVVTALLAGLVAAIPLGIVAQKVPWLGRIILGIVGILQTVPALALLALLVPIFGIGTAPAIATLFCYSMLPIVRNTHAGLNSVDPDLNEAAIGMGLTMWQKLRFVELPLAFPTLLAGVKTSTVMIIGFATLGAFVGAGGYGEPILSGIRVRDTGLILMGAVPAAVMALGSELLFGVAEQWAGRRGTA